MWKNLRPDATAVLKDRLVQKSLGRYFAVMQNQKVAKFKIAQTIAAEYSESDSLETLWRKHKKLTNQFDAAELDVDKASGFDKLLPNEKSYFDLKLEISRRILQNCHFCSRRCGVNRELGELGYCRCGKTVVVSAAFEHYGEEPELLPSGTIFTMGCTIRCKHCQNWSISQWKERGVECTPKELALEVERLRAGGCRNVNLVGGEPTPWLSQWLQAFKHVNVNVPLVWNSNSYYSPESAQLLYGFADVYLLDFKYGPGDCAERISEAPNYWQVCTENHLEAKNHGELIVRVLVLPSHLDCCTEPILKWISKNLGGETRVNVLFQYHLEWRAHEIPELRRSLSQKEREKAMEAARNAGLKNVLS